jgi:DNA-directed RNA polymerase II subunit RPB1
MACFFCIGSFCALNRHGLNKLDVGPLVKSGFEEIVDIVFEAALFGENQLINSIADNIMTGQFFSGGSGSVHLIGDENYLQHAVDKTNNTAKISITRTFYSSYANRAEDEIKIDISGSLSPIYIPEQNYEPTATSPRSFVASATSPVWYPESPKENSFQDLFQAKDEDIFNYRPTTPKIPTKMTYVPTSPIFNDELSIISSRLSYPITTQHPLYNEETGELQQNVLFKMIDENT